MREVNIANLFKLMKKNNIPACYVAKETGIAEASLSEWRTGKSFPTAKKLVILADFFDCSIEYLIGQTSEPQSTKIKQAPPLEPQSTKIKQVLSPVPAKIYQLAKKDEQSEDRDTLIEEITFLKVYEMKQSNKLDDSIGLIEFIQTEADRLKKMTNEEVFQAVLSDFAY